MKITIDISPEELLTLSGGDIIKQATEKAIEEFKKQCMIDPRTGFNLWFNQGFNQFPKKDGE